MRQLPAGVLEHLLIGDAAFGKTTLQGARACGHRARHLLQVGGAGRSRVVSRST